MKRATAKRDYGFVRKPELQHQYGMLFNHHGQVISGLKNMDLFLSIDLPKIEDIAHVPRLRQLGCSTQVQQKSPRVFLRARIWKRQPWTHD